MTTSRRESKVFKFRQLDSQTFLEIEQKHTNQNDQRHLVDRDHHGDHAH